MCNPGNEAKASSRTFVLVDLSNRVEARGWRKQIEYTVLHVCYCERYLLFR